MMPELLAIPRQTWLDVGNYSQAGNLVAFLLAQRMNVTQF